MMKNKSIRVKTIYQKIMIYYFALLILGNVFQYEPPYYILLIISIFVVFLSKRKIDTGFIKQYMFIILLALYGIIIALVTGGGIGGPLTIITGLMVCYAAQDMKFDKKDINLLVFAMCISILYWLYRSPTYYSEFFYNHWKGDATYTNSNGVGHYLAYECAFMFMILSLSGKKWVRHSKWILAIACVWGCYNVRARMAFFTLIVFLLMDFIIEKFSKRRNGLVKGFLIGSIVLEIVFPFVYLWMYISGIGNKIIMFGLTEKGLYSGREGIWLNAFNAMKNLPAVLFGIGSKHDFWEGNVLNMHNNAMNLLVVIGLFGLVLYFGYLIKYILKSFDFSKATKFQWQCLIFFICIIFEGATDITLFYNPFLAYYFIPLGIALSRNYTSLKGNDEK